MSKIVMKNADEVEGICPVTGKQFKTIGVGYYFDDRPISKEAAENRGFSVDKTFRLPQTISSREHLGLYLRSIGLRPGSPDYNKLYAEGRAILPEPKV